MSVIYLSIDAFIVGSPPVPYRFINARPQDDAACKPEQHEHQIGTGYLVQHKLCWEGTEKVKGQKCLEQDLHNLRENYQRIFIELDERITKLCEKINFAAPKGSVADGKLDEHQCVVGEKDQDNGNE